LAFTLWRVDSIKKTADSPLSENPNLDPKTFYGNLNESLVEHILSQMGKVPRGKLEKFGNQLLVIAHYISKMKERLDFEREAEKAIRASRVNLGRVKRKIQHSIEYLRQAEETAKGMQELRPDLRSLEPARKALERVEKRFTDLEASAAALIHPNLRKRGEGGLADKTPYKLQHPKFKPTPGSQQVLHSAVDMLDDEIQRFTRGKVPPHHVNEFIVEFLKLLEWNTSSANVKTIRFRRRRKASDDTSSDPRAHQ
jgi:hypothetical protein